MRSNCSLEQVAEWAEADAALTHPNSVCIQVNALFAMAITTAIRETLTATELYGQIKTWTKERHVEASVLRAIDLSATEAPLNFMQHMGWVLIAFQNALYQLLHATSLEEGVVDTVMRGRDAIPEQWQRNPLLPASGGHSGDIPAKTSLLLACGCAGSGSEAR